MGTAEAIVETYLLRRVAELGGETRKLQYVGRNGAPDRMLLFPGGRVFFVECKRPKGKAEKHQLRELESLKGLGFVAVVIDTKEDVDLFLDTVLTQVRNTELEAHQAYLTAVQELRE